MRRTTDYPAVTEKPRAFPDIAAEVNKLSDEQVEALFEYYENEASYLDLPTHGSRAGFPAEVLQHRCAVRARMEAIIAARENDAELKKLRAEALSAVKNSK